MHCQLLVLTAAVAIRSFTFAFNLDTDIPVFKVGERGTYFGFAVSQHFRGVQPLLLVGAPRAESTQPKTHQAGAVFSCPLNTLPTNGSGSASRADVWCQRERVEYPYIEEPGATDPFKEAPTVVSGQDVWAGGKDGQLLGTVVNSGGTASSRVVVCAPFLRFRLDAFTDGTCYVLDNDLRQELTIHTCDALSRSQRHNEYGACLEGFSAVYDPRYSLVVAGSPGAKKWTGGVTALSLPDSAQPTATRFTMGHADKNDSVTPPHSYLGFAVGAGRFGFWYEGESAESGQVTVVTGAPRLNDVGAVALLAFDPLYPDLSTMDDLLLLDDHFMLTGERLTSAFGHALAVLDLDNDGFDDLVVGAPFHYDFGGGKEAVLGAAFVYYSSGKKQGKKEPSHTVFDDPLKIFGSGGRFGISIAAVGDLNKDGYGDFAVGAPYHEGGGAVFVYHGKPREQFSTKPSQVILASDLGGRPSSKSLQTFGWSLSGGADLDDNGYPDLLVGAFASDTAVLLRSRPIIRVAVGPMQDDMLPVDRDSSNCDSSNYEACFDVHAWIRVLSDEGETSTHPFICRLEAVAAQAGVAVRAQFSAAGDAFVEWPCGRGARDSDHVETRRVLVGRSNNDWINPLKFVLSARLRSTEVPSQPAAGAALPNMRRFPVLDADGAVNEFFVFSGEPADSQCALPVQVPFNKKCGADNQCKTDLSVTCTFADLVYDDESDVYIKEVGKDDALNLHVKVENLGEHAYESALFVAYDSGELEVPELMRHDASQLVNLGDYSNDMVSVLLGNPLSEHSQVSFTLQFRLARGKSEGLGRALQFDAVANSTSVELQAETNGCAARVRVIKRAELRLDANSEPSEVRYGGAVLGESAMELEEDVGPLVVHRFTLTNEGPWSVSNVSVQIDFPREVQSPFAHGKWALYLLEAPISVTTVPGKATPDMRACNVEPAEDAINTLGLKLNTRYALRPPSVSRAKRAARSADADESRRHTRDLRLQPEIKVDKETNEEYRVVVVSCAKKTAKCLRIRCHFPYLQSGMSPVVHMRARLWSPTFVEDYRDVDFVEVISTAEIVIDPSQGIQDDDRNNFNEAVTRAYPDLPKILEETQVPWWVIVLAIVIGLFLLLLIMLLCWKCGFFDRKRRKRDYHQPLYQAELHGPNEQFSSS